MYKSQKRMNRISLILKRHTKMIVIQIEIRKKNQLEKCHFFSKVSTINLLLLICYGRETLCNFADEVTLATEIILKKLKQHLLNNSQNYYFAIKSNLLTF